MSAIDAHAHVLPREFPDIAGFPTMSRLSGETARRLTFGTTDYVAADVYFDAGRRVAAMDAAGVAEEIVSPMPPLLNFALEAGVARDLFRFVSENVAEIASAGAGRIHGYGVVPLQDPDLAAAELAGLVDLGLRGVEVASHVAGTPIGDARFAGFFAEAERLDLGVFVHTLPRLDEVGVDPALRASIGVGIEAARGAASLALGPIGDTCVLDRVLFSHAAGGLPLVLARADYFWSTADAANRPAERPSDRARRFLYDSMVFDARGLRFAIDYLGTDRIVLGTDYPAMPRPSRLDSLLDDLDLDLADRDRILSGNARRMLDPVSSPVA